MSLMINGMDMPKNRGFFYDLLLSFSVDGSGEIFFNRKSYPIVEIPAPHGRLIDADKLIAVLKSAIPIEQRTSAVCCVMKNIENAPTVIEAEK